MFVITCAFIASTSSVCNNTPSGFEWLRWGVDAGDVNFLLPPDEGPPSFLKTTVLTNFTCAGKKGPDNFRNKYDLPHEIKSILLLGGGSTKWTETNYTSLTDVTGAMKVDLDSEDFFEEGMASVGLSCKILLEHFTQNTRFVADVIMTIQWYKAAPQEPASSKMDNELRDSSEAVDQAFEDDVDEYLKFIGKFETHFFEEATFVVVFHLGIVKTANKDSASAQIETKIETDDIMFIEGVLSMGGVSVDLRGRVL